MDDTKSMIERYKRELMELMKTSPKADPAPKEPAPKEPAPQPRVIGYVDEETHVPDEYGQLISEIEDSSEDNEQIAENIEESADETVAETEPEMDVPRERESAIGENPTDEELARGSRGTAATGAPGASYPEPKYDSWEQFTERNIGRGTLVFRVYTAREAFPIKGATVTLSKRIADKPYEIATLETDNSGQTPPQTLPAPSKELSQHVENEVQPFALYDATIRKADFSDVILRDIPVFDGVQSIQRVAMIPADEGGESEEITEVPNANE